MKTLTIKTIRYLIKKFLYSYGADSPLALEALYNRLKKSNWTNKDNVFWKASKSKEACISLSGGGKKYEFDKPSYYIKINLKRMNISTNL